MAQIGQSIKQNQRLKEEICQQKPDHLQQVKMNLENISEQLSSLKNTLRIDLQIVAQMRQDLMKQLKYTENADRIHKINMMPYHESHYYQKPNPPSQ